MIEVLSAMSLFALVASGVGKLATGSMRYTIANRHGTAASMLAQRELEELRGRAYADILPGSYPKTVAAQLYTVATSVIDDNPAAGMKLITVTVGWTGPEGPKHYAVQTIFTAITT
jgi:Tfp pilus assembly protein PilV